MTPVDPDKSEPPKDAKCTIFLGYTSNLISSGLRETIRFLVEHKHVSCVVTTAGGIEEDLIKCLAPTFLGSFTSDGKVLREGGLNRIGNLVVPNDNYCAFEDWLTPILNQMLVEQENGTRWTPSRMIHRLGKEINHPDSVLYWAYKVPSSSPYSNLERHPSVLAGTNGRITRRHALLPHLKKHIKHVNAETPDSRYNPGHRRDKHTSSPCVLHRHHHPRRRTHKTPHM